MPYYKPTEFYAGDNLNYEVTIKPVATVSSASDAITIYNKKRERFRLDVPVKLTLEGVVIDSIDSILHSQTTGTALPDCLSERRICCKLTIATDTVENYDSADTGTFSCGDSFDTLF